MSCRSNDARSTKTLNDKLFKAGQISLLALSVHSAFAFAESETEAEFDGEVMVVTGSRVEQKLEDVIGSVSVITDTQIERLMVTNLDDMFRYDPSITTTGNGASPQAINVRGIGGNRLVYIKDGRRLNDSYAGGTGLIVGRNNFDVQDIKQVEVAKGAASSLYGSDGLGGIVVVSTKDPEDYLGGQDSYVRLGAGYLGNSEQTNVNLAAAKAFGDWKTSITVIQRQGEEVQNFDESLPGFDADSTAVTLKAQRALSKDSGLKFTFDWFSQDTDQVITAGASEVHNQDTNWAVSADYYSEQSTALFDRWQTQVYFSRYEQDGDAIVSSRGNIDQNDYDFNQDIFGVRALFNKAMTSGQTTHNIVYGFDYDLFDTTRPRFKTRTAADGTVTFTNEPQPTFPGADTTMAGIFLQDTIDFAPYKVSVVIGGRLDYYSLEAKADPLYDATIMEDIDETAFSPKVALRYQFNDNWQSYLQYVQGFKIPPHDQAYQSHGVEPFYQILPNPDLDPEESESYELGIRYNNDVISASAAVFRAEFDNFIESTLVGTEPTFIPGVTKSLFQYQNLESVTIEGLEFGLTLRPTDRLSIVTQATYIDGENDENGQALESLSPLQGSVLTTYDFDQFSLTAAWRLAKSMTDVPTDSDGNDLVQSAGYGVLDLFGQVELDNWVVTARVDNVLDKEYIPYQNIAGQAPDADLNQFTQPGRTFSIGASYTF